MAVTTSNDDGFREIQLNGKQLVFLFMAVTVVLVVTFLTGVLVGRGVRAERVAEQQTEALNEAPATPPPAVVPPPAGADPTVAPPPEPPADGPVTTDTKPPAQEAEPPVAVKRSAPVETSASQPKAAETPKTSPPARAASEPAAAIKTPAPAASAPKPAASAPAAAAGATPPQPATPAAAATDSPARDGYAVQVAAVNVRGEADSIVKRLSGKGYSAYVEDPKGSQKMYRVRVGTFKTRREAQTVADKLKKDEKFKPWVTR